MLDTVWKKKDKIMHLRASECFGVFFLKQISILFFGYTWHFGSKDHQQRSDSQLKKRLQGLIAGY